MSTSSPLASAATSAAAPAVVLRGAGVFLAPGVETAEQIATQSGLPLAVVRDKMGIVQKRRAPPDLHPSAMAVEAARLALGDVDPLSLDAVIWTGSEYKDHLVWTAAIHVQRELGAKNAYAFDLSARCSTGILGLELAHALVLSRPKLRRVLLCGGHRTGDLVNYTDPNSRFLYNLADGGSAMLLERADDLADGAAAGDGRSGAELLRTAIVTDGDFSKDVLIPAGGTVLPTRAHPDPETTFLAVPDPAGMKDRLDRVSLANFLRVIREAAAGEPIAHLALLHMKRSAHDAILGELGLSQDQSIYLDTYGHFGSPDQVLSLGLAERAGRLQPGDLVVFASAGLGYMWAAAALRWRGSTFSAEARAAI